VKSLVARVVLNIIALLLVSLGPGMQVQSQRPTPAVQQLIDSTRGIHMRIARQRLEQAVALAIKTNDKSGQALAEYGLGLALNYLELKREALVEMKKARVLQHDLRDSKGEGQTITAMGNLLRELGDSREAEQLLKEALQIALKTHDESAEAATRNALGSLLGDLNRNEEAIDEIQQALAIRKKQNNRREIGVCLNNLGSAYANLNQNETALSYYFQALPIRRELPDPRQESLPITLTNIGTAYYDLGQYDQALEYLNQARTLFHSVDRQDSEFEVVADIASVYSAMGKKTSALEMLRQALPIARQKGEKPFEADVLNKMGALECDLKNYEAGLDLCSQAQAMMRQIGDRGSEAEALDNIGAAHFDQGHIPEALSDFQAALAMRREVRSRDGEAITLAWLERIYEKLHKPSAAIAFGKLAVNITQTLRRDIRNLPEPLQRSLREKERDVYQALASRLAAQGRIPEAVQTMALVNDDQYQQFLTRGTAPALDLNIELTPAEQTFMRGYEERAQHLAKIRDTIASGGPAKDQASALQSTTKDLLAYISEAESKIDNSGIANKLSNTSEYAKLQGRLASTPKTAAIYAWQDGESVNLMFVSPKQVVTKTSQIASALGGASLSDRILFMLVQLRSRDNVPLSSSGLYDLLIRPLEKEVESCDTVLWCLDGTLRYIPIAALYDSSKHRYAVEEFGSALFTPTMLDRVRDKPSETRWQGVGFCVTKAHEAMPALPNAEQEMRRIFAPNVLQGTWYRDELFTEAAFEKAMLTKPGVVHIASHFNFLPANGIESFLLLGDGSHLTLRQLSSRSNFFQGVELLTLSSCQTAVGTEGANGNEVQGLALLAQKQGAASVLATLWPVEDESTSLFMAEFYRRKAENPHLSKLVVLRTVQLQLLKGDNTEGNSGQDHRFAHPYYWAPFVLLGDWN